MTDAAAQESLLKSLAVLTKVSKLHDEFGHMVTDALTRMGIKTALFQDTTEGLDRWPAVLVIGDVYLLEQYDAYFRGPGEQKPYVLLWFLEFLGPGRMSEATMRLGKRLAHCYRSPRLPDFLPRSGPLCAVLRIVYGELLKRRIEQDLSCRCENLTGRDLFLMMYRTERLVRHFKAPWVNKLITSMVSRKEHLRHYGIDAEVVPVGWHPLWGQYQDKTRDIDIVFLGHRRRRGERRSSVLRSVQKKLASHGYSVTVVDRNCYGQQRTDLLNRTKILLDVVRAPWELPGMRLLIGLSCGALVVSAGFSGDSSPYRNGTHFVAAANDTLADTLLYYLKNEDARRTIAAAGRSFVTQTLTLENTLRSLLTDPFQK